MKQKAISSIVILFALAFLAIVANAQSQMQQTYWHNSDYYSIQLDGIGNGFVSVQMNLQSLSRTPVNVITLNIPYQNVTIYRIISVNGSYYGCLGCAYPQYYNNNPQFVNYSTSPLGNGTLLKLYLNKPLTNSSQVTMYIFFSTRNLAQSGPLGYTFTFKTILDPNALIRDAYAGVQVPQNMYLKGEPIFNINYDAAAQSKLVSATTASSAAALIPTIFPYYGYQYHSSNLLSGEYFTITGLYGNNLALLYLPEIVEGAVVFVVIILLLRWLFWARLKKLFSRKEKPKFSYSRPIIFGSISGFLFQIAYFSMQFISNFVFGGYYYNSPLPILFALLDLIVFGLALFGLPYYLYSKYSKKEGVVAGILSIIASVIYFVIIAYFFLQPIVYPVIYNRGVAPA